MRLALIFPLALVAVPAAAQERIAPRPAPDATRVVAALNDPLVQEGVATVVSQFADAFLATHVGPLAHYADPRDHVRPDTTLRDLAHRSDPALERHLHDDARTGAVMVGRSAKDAVAMTAELHATAERLRRVFDSASQAVDTAGSAY